MGRRLQHDHRNLWDARLGKRNTPFHQDQLTTLKIGKTFKEWNPEGDEKSGEAELFYLMNSRYPRFFSKITHLELLDRLWEGDDVEILPYFTSLTHLCVSKDSAPEVLNHIVRMCPDLEVIILLDRHELYEPLESPNDVDLITAVEDSREMNKILDQIKVHEIGRGKMVLLYCRDAVAAWEKGVMGGEDMWAIADRIVNERLQTS
ncbi:hypothetical protein BDN72DRAFT_899210 [Pluteus cervinus]|uniref:Uncharacterized protein n=1 Tax=Pluteus cervinus TaxID=181527 RepID=A0ACD3AN34_9AGAR|nr:hypothetical protein BDN72DRAFT_899210 [Pluteus cervinus]